MITNKTLIENFKKLLDDKYVFYCGSGLAFENARNKTLDVVYNIPHCFSVLGVLVKYEVIMEEINEKEYIYKTKEGKVVATIFDDKKFIKFAGTKEPIEFATMKFDFKDNATFSRYSNSMINLLKKELDDESLEIIIQKMIKTQTNWKNKDELYNMMY